MSAPSGPAEGAAVSEVDAAPEARARARAARKRARERRGVALVMVLAAITVLTVFLTQLQDETSADLSAALAERDAVRAEYHAKSAANLARLMIATEPTIRAGVLPLLMIATGGKGAPPQIPVWEFADQLLGVFNGGDGKSDFAGMAAVDLSTSKNLGLDGGGSFRVKIVDEDSKINLNVASQGTVFAHNRLSAQLLGTMGGPQYVELFAGRDPDGQFSDAMTVCGAMIDWVDADEESYVCDPTGLAPSGGVEDNYYQTIGLTYRRKNAPFDSLEELRMVRGVGDDFWTTFVEPEPGRPEKRVMTVWGQGAINVNTANVQTLLAIACGLEPTATLCVDPAQASGFIMVLQLFKSFTAGVPIFSTPQDFVAMLTGSHPMSPLLQGFGFTPIALTDPKAALKAVTTSSKVFSIYTEGVVPGSKNRETVVRLHTVVDFRSAPQVSGLAGPMVAGGTPQQPVLGPNGEEIAPPPAIDPNDPASLFAAMNANPAGTVIYSRIE
jgi:general secretion pathway protein K